MVHVDVMTILGARPQFIKASAVTPQLASQGVRELLVHTGQHFDDNMSRVFFDELGLRVADVNLDIHGGNHGEQTGRMMISLEELMLARKPDVVMVYGDTNTTLAGALVAAKLHIPVVHIEAGLRSFNKRMPEEINRICTDHVASLLFTASETGSKNLLDEGFSKEKIVYSGDVMYDVALRFGSIAKEQSSVLRKLSIHDRRYALVTVHRAENTDDRARLASIINGLCVIADELDVVMPVHPRTRNALQAAGVWRQAEKKLMLIDPVGYLDMIRLEMAATLILTDSGGVQKEAYFHQVPCVTLRDETEWSELVEHGFNTLAGADEAKMVAATKRALSSSSLNWGKQIYGSGNAGEIIASKVVTFCK